MSEKTKRRILSLEELKLLLPGDHLPAPVSRDKIPPSCAGACPTFFYYFIDSAWDVYVSYWLFMAEDARAGINESYITGLAIPEPVLTKLEKTYKGIHDLANSYKKNMEKPRDRPSARYAAKQIEIKVRGYRSSKTTSETLALALSAPNPGYKKLLSKQNKRDSFRHRDHGVDAMNKSRRKEAFAKIISWLDSAYSPPGTNEAMKAAAGEDIRVFWLTGEAHSGKSVMAHTLAEMLDKRKALATGFIFRESPDVSAVLDSFLANVVLDIVDYIGPELELAVMQVMKGLTERRDEFFDLKLSVQLEKLLAPTWKRLQADSRSPLLVILDGLDKISDVRKQKDVIEMVQVSLSKLPIHYLITSRPTEYISGCMSMLGGRVMEFKLDIYEEPADSFGDGPTPTQATFDISSSPSSADAGELAPAFKQMGLGIGGEEGDNSEKDFSDAE